MNSGQVGNDGTDLPDSDENESLYLTTTEIAKLIPWSDRGVRNLLKDGRLVGSIPTGKKWVISRDSYGRFLAEEETKSNTTSVAESMDTWTIEVKNRHIEDLLAVASKWNEQLVFNVGDAIYVEESLVPNIFTEQDKVVGWHQKGPVIWLVEHNGDVGVWLAVERKEDLFQEFLEHAPAEVGDTYEALKSKVAQGIKCAKGRGDSDIVNLVFALSRELKDILAARTMGGSCRICNKLAEA